MWKVKNGDPWINWKPHENKLMPFIKANRCETLFSLYWLQPTAYK